MSNRGIDRERLGRLMLESGLGPDLGDLVRLQRRDRPPAFVSPRPWWVGRCAGSLGDADLVALRQGLSEPGMFGMLAEALLVEVKSSSLARGPYADFLPSDRLEIAEAAQLAGAEAWLLWIPPTLPGMTGVFGCWIPESEWPNIRALAP